MNRKLPGRPGVACICVFILYLFSSCSMTKGLKEGVLLHRETEITFVNPKKVNKKKKLTSELTMIARPNPVTGLEKWRVGIYQSVNKKQKEKGIGAWIQRKIGKPPVLYDHEKVNQSLRVMEKYLQDQGYFGSSITLDTTLRKKKVKVQYQVTSCGQYYIREIHRPVADTLPLIRCLHEYEEQTLLKEGRPYELSLLTGERSRMAETANNHGFYEVTKDDFYYFVDTTAGNYQTDLYIRTRQKTDSLSYQVHYLKDAWIFPRYSLEPDEQVVDKDTLFHENNRIVQEEKILRSSVLNRLIWQEDDPVFSKEEQRNTINRLLNLGVYKFANIRFNRTVVQDTPRLDRYIYLTPGLMRDLILELQVNSRSGNFLGTEVSTTFSHKNLFRGAEQLNISLSAGLEMNIGANAGSLINTLNIGLNANLGLPGIYAPFIERKRIRGETLPRTSFNIGDDFQQRTGFFTVNSFNFSAGYSWQRSRWQQQFNPLFVNLVNVLETSAKLDELLLENSRLRSSFENVFIIGISHKVSFSNQTDARKDRFFYWQGGVESAGGMLSILTSARKATTSRKIFGIPFSQYLKFDSDFRQYYPLRKGMLAGRFNFGIGYAYDNAETMPYIKQYFIGGASSVRAFRIRTLGPGAYETRIQDDGSNFIDQTGDMKIELNLEYRFPIISYLKGALFADAGNIWLIRGDADESTPEADGLFHFDRFYKELAIGTGAGLRIDFDVAVIRLDIAFPIRLPSQSEGTRWLFSEINLVDKKWRRENVVWNVAIGYPF